LAMMRKANLVPDVITYTAAINACEKSMQWDMALCLLAVMQQAAVVPNIITYSAAISAGERGEQWQQAVDHIAEMQLHIYLFLTAVSACEKGEP
jgi:pentatricopeptide repeat domain-containing protein 1